MKKFILLLAFVGITANAEICPDCKVTCKDGTILRISQEDTPCVPSNSSAIPFVEKKCDTLHGGHLSTVCPPHY